MLNVAPHGAWPFTAFEVKKQEISTIRNITKMDTTILLIGVAIVAAFVIPMYYINKHGKAHKQKKMQELESFAQSNGLKLTDIEYFKDKTLALDRGSRKLVYIDHAGSTQIIDLANVSNVKLDREYENEEKKIIGSIEIILSSKDGNVTIPFYHHTKKNSLDLYEQNESSKIWIRNIETCKAGKAKEANAI